MAYFMKRYHPPGTSPGTLQQIEKAKVVPLKITLTDYTQAEFTEIELATAEESRKYLERDTVTWIHVQGDTGPDTMRQLGKLFGLHHLALEDVINTGQRPKIDFYKEQTFIVLAHPVINSATNEVKMTQISLFTGHNFLISFHPGEDDPFSPIRQRLRDHVGRIRQRNSDYLQYALIDMVIDEGFPVLELLGDEIEKLEDELLDTPTKSSLHQLHRIKRTLLNVRRMLWPHRELLNNLVRDDTGLVADETKIYFRDCYDHSIQLMDLIESYRDMVTGLLDIYLSSVSYRLNEVMRVLTIISTIFIPLTFIVGLYGMNFSNERSPWAMPELHWYFGYPFVWGLMILNVLGMLLFFRRKKWL